MRGERDDLTLLGVRRAELAAEAALAHAAVDGVAPELVDRIGPCPRTGPERAVWERAVAAVAVYHARHWPDASRHELGLPPEADQDAPEQRWHDLRHAAHALAVGWANVLGDQRTDRFHRQRESLPRRRAVAGIHALLDAGWTPDVLAAELTQREQDTVRSGAAVLDHRVRLLLDRYHIDATPYEMAPAPTPREEWEQATRLIEAAEANHASTRPPTQQGLTRDLTAVPPAAATGLDLGGSP